MIVLQNFLNFITRSDILKSGIVIFQRLLEHGIFAPTVFNTFAFDFRTIWSSDISSHCSSPMISGFPARIVTTTLVTWVILPLQSNLSFFRLVRKQKTRARPPSVPIAGRIFRAPPSEQQKTCVHATQLVRIPPSLTLKRVQTYFSLRLSVFLVRNRTLFNRTATMLSGLFLAFFRFVISDLIWSSSMTTTSSQFLLQGKRRTS